MALRGFNTSSDTITLKGNHILCSRCKRPDGSWGFSELDLNDCLGNNNGKFVWGGGSFADSAAQVHLALEGADARPMLHAQLNDRHGSVQSASVNLAECIQNEAGGLEYMHC
ncbi:CVNH domain-containing protein [Aspergillus clavatus NRRL 1]|uniref:Cyanovirin-N family protein n=1 Tax=Aspergillus clavatus (strain ATCC 1007 / CBS 513.65 / DSM 816 / NCTC 3887 / NRRL 1 / QM 1276 / 107) TaxID=344612 RepID=A1CFK1_ASPCL|nr:cyanovirin-N family protein [Aspergillus clavatus NRRL 1]EAW11650.1 cyanovirin-N family protein [Aspergillus clavatus NRRL 1]